MKQKIIIFSIVIFIAIIIIIGIIFYLRQPEKDAVIVPYKKPKETEEFKKMEESGEAGFIKIGLEYDNAWMPLNVNDQLVFTAEKGGKTFLVIDGKEIGKEFDEVDHPLVKSGKLVFFTNNSKKAVWYDVETGEQEIDDSVDEKMYSEMYENFMEEYFGYGDYLNSFNQTCIEIRGEKICKNKEEKYLEYDSGKKVGEEYDDVNFLTEYKNDLLYVARKDNKYFIVYQEKKISKDYDKILYPLEYNELLIYVAESGEEKFIVIEEKEDKHYDDILTVPIIINDKLTYKAKDKNKEVVIYGDVEGEKFDSITLPLILIDNKLVYSAELREKLFIVKEK